MKSWRTRLLALLTVVAMLLAVLGPAAMARTVCDVNGNCFQTGPNFNNGYINNGYCGYDQFGNPIPCGLNGYNNGVNPYYYNNGVNPYYYNDQYYGSCYGGGNVAQQALDVALC